MSSKNTPVPKRAQSRNVTKNAKKRTNKKSVNKAGKSIDAVPNEDLLGTQALNKSSKLRLGAAVMFTRQRHVKN